METIELKTGIGVYCKGGCGGIIYCVTDDCYSRDKSSRKEVDEYFDKGYTVSKVSKKEVQELFGCTCENKKLKLF